MPDAAMSDTMLERSPPCLSLRGPDGKVTGYLRVPDKTDPVYQAHLDAQFAQLDATLDRVANELGVTREELVERLSRD